MEGYQNTPLLQEPVPDPDNRLPEISLSPDTVLQLAPNFRTRLDAAGHVILDSPAGTMIDIGPRGFAILSMFSRPVTLGDALERLEAELGGSTDFAPTISVINMLIEENTLVALAAGQAPTTGWADPIEHARMLHDDRRTCDFIAALTAAVRPGDIVLDIGTGSGVLAVALARAGARHVYAVEASDIAAVAARVFEANGVTDCVTLVPGWSRQIELPERADLLVAEIIGNEPFEEEILETTLDARRRLLKPRARLVPHALELLARPLLLPEAEFRQRAFGRAAVESWHDLYGMDFQPLLDVASQDPVYSVAEGEVVAAWPAAGPPAVLTSVNLTAFEDASVQAFTDLVVDPPGPVNAVTVTFRARLHGAIAHTLDPWAWPSSSWATSVWVLPEPVKVGPESALRASYCRRVAGKPDGLTVEVVDRARTILSG
jgi:protein arginine N-methyltransferase 1